MARDEFDKAWQMLQAPVQKAVKSTDTAAVVATLVRFSAHLHMSAMKQLGLSQEEARRRFIEHAETCFDQQVRDGSWVNTS